MLASGNMVSKRAQILLVKQIEVASAERRGREEVGMVPHPNEVDFVDVDDSTGAEKLVGREKKKHRVDDLSKKNPFLKTIEKGIVIGSSERLKDAGPGLQVGLRAGPILIEIGPNERWNLGDKQPVQAFGAFKLPSDSNSYAGFSRGELARRSRRRLGQFISDYERVLDDDVNLSNLTDEVDQGKRKLAEANQTISELGAREKSLLEKMEAADRAQLSLKGEFDSKLNDVMAEVARLKSENEVLLSSKDRVDTENRKLYAELVAARNDLKEADQELLKSLEDGYNGCLARWAATGADLADHTFAKWSA